MAKTIEHRPPSETTPGGRRPRPPWKPWFLGVSAVVALAVAAGSLYYGWLYVYTDSQIRTLPTHVTRHIHPECSPACNYLIMGTDSRQGLGKGEQSMFGTGRTVPGQRSDTIMLVRIDPREKRVVALSFPRDLWVRIPGEGMGKITSAYEGGPDRVAQVVENLTGLDVNHFLSVNLAGFEGVVRTLGGVPMCIDRPLRDRLAGLNLKPGCQNVSPQQALAFVRARHVCGDRIPDFSRISRQQQFLRAVLAKVLSPGMLFHAKALIDEASSGLLRDKDLNTAEIVYLTHQLQGIGTGAVDFRSVPGNPFATVQTPKGTVDIVRMKAQAKVLFARLREGKPLGDIGKVLQGTPPSPATITVRVFDNSSGGVAAKASDRLTKAGFDIRPTVAAGALASRGPAILYRPGALRAAKQVSGYLPDLPLKQAPRGALSVAVAVVVDASVTVPSLAPSPSPSGGAQTPACS